MTYCLTLVSSSGPLTTAHIAMAERHIAASSSVKWLAEHKAADIYIDLCPDNTQIKSLRADLSKDKIDVFINPVIARRKKLLLADMDSTIVTCETLDELAKSAGIGDQIAAITARAMRGEIDFIGALRERVSMIKDLPESALRDELQSINLSDGALQLVQTMKNHGATCVLVSGGFTFFTEAIGKIAGFHHHHGNVLDIKNGKLTGKVIDPILDRDAKLRYLKDYIDKLGIKPEDTMSIGDGANDLAMLSYAGLGVGYHPKPLLLDTLRNCIVHGDLTASLYAQGYTDQEIHA